MILDSIFIAVGFGLPVAVLTWYLFLRLYKAGKLDRSLGHKALKPELKALKKQNKDKQTRSTHLLHNRWMRFGGGFYGLAGLWTFIVVEVKDTAGFVWDFPGFEALFADGVISLLADVLANQITNFVTAITWFVYWGKDGVGIPISMAVAYLSYLLGMHLARKDTEVSLSGLSSFLLSTLKQYRPTVQGRGKDPE